MVGEDEDDRVVVGVLEQPGDQPVDVAVVVEDRVLVLAAGLVLSVLGIHELPEPVVHPVRAHLDHREERPRLRLREVLGQLEAPIGHLVNLAEQVMLVVGAEVFGVEDVLADDVFDLVPQRGRIRVLALERRREEAADHDAVQRPRRVRAGTLRTTDEPPARVTRSQSRGSRIASLIAMKPPSYVWSERFRKP